MDISIIIVNWETADFLRHCLRSVVSELSDQSRFDTEIIVVDNASQDGSIEMIKTDFPQVILIENKENFGFAKANNQAIHTSSGEMLLFLNPDTIIKPGAILSLAKYLEEHSDTGIVAPLVLNGDGTTQISAFRFPTLFREFWRLFKLDGFLPLSYYSPDYFKGKNPRNADVVLGACFLVREQCLDQIGLFDDQYFVYSEEVDLCLRAHEAGWKISWLPQASIIHFGGKSTSKVSDKMFIELNRNKTRYFRKHHGKLVAQIYKLLLCIISIIRILASEFIKYFKFSEKVIRPDLGRQYKLLLEYIKDF